MSWSNNLIRNVVRKRRWRVSFCCGRFPIDAERLSANGERDFSCIHVSGEIWQPFKLLQLRIRSCIENDQHWNKSACLAVNGEIELFLPAPLSGRRNRYSNFELVSFLLSNTVNLSPFHAVIGPANRTVLRGERHAADRMSYDRLEKVASFLTGPIVDIEEPLPPEEQTGKGLGAHRTIL